MHKILVLFLNFILFDYDSLGIYGAQIHGSNPQGYFEYIQWLFDISIYIFYTCCKIATAKSSWRLFDPWNFLSNERHYIQNPVIYW